MLFRLGTRTGFGATRALPLVRRKRAREGIKQSRVRPASFLNCESDYVWFVNLIASGDAGRITPRGKPCAAVPRKSSFFKELRDVPAFVPDHALFLWSGKETAFQLAVLAALRSIAQPLTNASIDDSAPGGPATVGN